MWKPFGHGKKKENTTIDYTIAVRTIDSRYLEIIKNFSENVIDNKAMITSLGSVLKDELSVHQRAIIKAVEGIYYARDGNFEHANQLARELRQNRDELNKSLNYVDYPFESFFFSEFRLLLVYPEGMREDLSDQEKRTFAEENFKTFRECMMDEGLIHLYLSSLYNELGELDNATCEGKIGLEKLPADSLLNMIGKSWYGLLLKKNGRSGAKGYFKEAIKAHYELRPFLMETEESEYYRHWLDIAHDSV